MRLARLGTLLVLCTACDAGFPTGDISDAAAVANDGGASREDAGVHPAPDERALCFDELDNDEDGAEDCGDSDCSDRNVCCVGSGDPSCCAPEGVARSLVEPGCEDGVAATCVNTSDVVLFGDPTIEDGALVPQGGADRGGVSLADPIDPRAANLVIEASIETPEVRCTSDCSDGAGIALFDRPPGPGARVLLGLLVSGSRNEILVLVAEDAVARFPLEPGTDDYSMTVDVEGNATFASNAGVLTQIGGLALPSRVWVAVFGRTTNRSAGEEAVRVRSASATSFACDAPAALDRTSAALLPWSGTAWAPIEVRRPSVASYTEVVGEAPRLLMVFAYEGALYFAERTGDREYRGASGDPGSPALTLGDTNLRARDPWLATTSDRRFVLFYVQADAEGGSTVQRALGGEGFARTFEEPVLAIDPVALSIDRLDGISVVPGEAQWTMAARATRGSTQHLVLLDSFDEGATWSLRGGSIASASIRTSSPHDLFAFDRDEIATPALISHPDIDGRPLERLYYSGRRGTHWSIGLLVSDDGESWRSVGPVLEPGSAGRFDALGVADPMPLVEDGAIHLLYAGTNGNGWRIGEAGPPGTVGE